MGGLLQSFNSVTSKSDRDDQRIFGFEIFHSGNLFGLENWASIFWVLSLKRDVIAYSRQFEEWCSAPGIYQEHSSVR